MLNTSCQECSQKLVKGWIAMHNVAIQYMPEVMKPYNKI